jgi:hypothetical protein
MIYAECMGYAVCEMYVSTPQYGYVWLFSVCVGYEIVWSLCTTLRWPRAYSSLCEIVRWPRAYSSLCEIVWWPRAYSRVVCDWCVCDL